MYVEVFETVEGGQVPWFRVYYTDKVVDISEAPDKLRNIWDKFGIPYKGKRVHPKEGKVFLEAVARDYNGSMVRASKPIDNEDEETLREG